MGHRQGKPLLERYNSSKSLFTAQRRVHHARASLVQNSTENDMDEDIFDDDAYGDDVDADEDEKFDGSQLFAESGSEDS